MLFVAAGCVSSLKTEAEKAYNRGEYSSAALSYRKLYKKANKKHKNDVAALAAYRAGICYMKLRRAPQASVYLRNADRLGYKDARLNIMLGQSLCMEGKYAEAKLIFSKHLSTHPNSFEALSGIECCEFAVSGASKRKRATVSMLRMINSSRSDFSPAMRPNQSNQLYFISERSLGKAKSNKAGMAHGNIWFTRMNNRSEWLKPMPAEGYINSEAAENSICFSPDGETMYFSKVNENGKHGLFCSKRKGGLWNAPEPINLGEECYNYMHPALSNDGYFLYFASDRKGGSGGYDIWRMYLPTGSIANMGENINTPGHEVFPSTANEEEFYFSSDTHVGLGGLDIFKAKITGPGEWIVSNIGAPLNSSADDFGIIFNDEISGYLSSNRSDSRGYSNIYGFEIPKQKLAFMGTVADMNNSPICKSTVTIVGSDGKIERCMTDENGNFRIDVNRGETYAVQASANGYLSAYQRFETDDDDEDAIYSIEFMLAPFAERIFSTNVFYDSNDADLAEESIAGIDSIASLLKQNRMLKVRIASHADQNGSAEYNQRLSEQRALVATDYLIKTGVEPERITQKGYGSSRPKTITDNDAMMLTLFYKGTTLSPEFISTLPDSLKAAADRFNRRTEFVIGEEENKNLLPNND